MKNFYILALVLVATLFASQCSELSPRQKCYEDNYCKSADSDCIAASILITSLFENSNSKGNNGTTNGGNTTTNSNSSSSLLSLFYNPLFCIGSKASCEADCDKKHPY
ncbi:hypothetical protein MAL08_16080 [Leptospira noguchii]|uniref:Lipoprotein n=2 Tax=Leptospira noguchii TaxID=28182 RepID=M6U700_9LEPT|nr:hypothetical protein [Leptospira noguchii]EKR75204.1 hypothetical protein LEP1GSC041_2258 [Leptospira noguchii str. 2006001870]EMI60432.1 hypothetical protein LEP1GSC072_3198 [Leptospira noguchii str. Bonito]EMO40275.1 hypothetical protein LEP1GSC186_3902 [Leptospira noguchii serovar Autumnalis str. ZUN142]EMS86651.1 hypothetical protein LEP1GSC073_3698 [Leptospira noguchii str. Cascata]TQE71548.1 hypothetical protein FF021_14170 [Leptospira noguchii]